MQRNYTRMISEADNRDRDQFKFENVWPTFSNLNLIFLLQFSKIEFISVRSFILNSLYFLELSM